MNKADLGGAIHACWFSSVNINTCHFSTNTADTGGVIFVHGSSVNVNDSTFVNNTATQGGVIGLKRSDAKVVLCTFEKNHAYKGGVVYATQCPVMQMHDVTLSSNSARVKSGGDVLG